MSFDEWMKAGQLSVSAAGVIVALLGIGLAKHAWSNWKREMRGKADFELARRTMLAVYRMGHAISHVRNIFGSKDQTERLDVMAKAHDELSVCLLEARVIWGTLLSDANEQLWSIEKDVVLAVRRVQRAESDSRARESMEKRGTLEKENQIAWGDESDQTGQRITAVIATFEKLLGPHLQR